MKQDEIIEIANQTELCQSIWIDDADDEVVQSVIQFAKLVAAKERENNVKLLMRLADSYEHADKQGSADDIYKIVNYIREKGKA
jgi:GH35 family endo-1,4-beta-xylanase